MLQAIYVAAFAFKKTQSTCISTIYLCFISHDLRPVNNIWYPRMSVFCYTTIISHDLWFFELYSLSPNVSILLRYVASNANVAFAFKIRNHRALRCFLDLSFKIRNHRALRCFLDLSCYSVSVQLTDYSKWRITQCCVEDTTVIYLYLRKHFSKGEEEFFFKIYFF